MVVLVKYLVTKSGIQSDGQVSNVVMAVAYNTKYKVKSSRVESRSYHHQLAPNFSLQADPRAN